MGTHAKVEVVAIMLAGTEILNSGLKHQLTILSDSQAAIKAITKESSSSLSHPAGLIQLEQPQSVYLIWVKAYVGYDLNEQADHLAKEGTTYQNVFTICMSHRISSHEVHLK